MTVWNMQDKKLFQKLSAYLLELREYNLVYFRLGAGVRLKSSKNVNVVDVMILWPVLRYWSRSNILQVLLVLLENNDEFFYNTSACLRNRIRKTQNTRKEKCLFYFNLKFVKNLVRYHFQSDTGHYYKGLARIREKFSKRLI